MALKNVIGIDHAVVMVKDLDKSAENYRRLGFTVSPRGTHSAHMGSGNYTIMFDPDYMELLGVLTPTEHNAPARAFLEKRGEGIERIAFTAVDSADGAEEIRARGYPPVGPTDFERPVTMPDGTISAAKFRTFQWPTAEAPGGVRIFACQHKTRETVWIPELMKHANGAKRLRQVLIVSPEPAKDAAHMSRMIDRDVRTEQDGAIAVPSGSDRADFVFLTRDQLSKRYPEVSLTGLPERGGAGLVIAGRCRCRREGARRHRRSQRWRRDRAARRRQRHPARLRQGVTGSARRCIGDSRIMAKGKSEPDGDTATIRRGRPRSAETTNAILQSAYTLMATTGLAATSIDAVARDSNVSKMTIYKWWPSREALLIDAFLHHASLDAAAADGPAHRQTA